MFNRGEGLEKKKKGEKRELEKLPLAFPGFAA
jgi:hypothetical protein